MSSASGIDVATTNTSATAGKPKQVKLVLLGMKLSQLSLYSNSINFARIQANLL